MGGGKINLLRWVSRPSKEAPLMNRTFTNIQVGRVISLEVLVFSFCLLVAPVCGLRENVKMCTSRSNFFFLWIPQLFFFFRVFPSIFHSLPFCLTCPSLLVFFSNLPSWLIRPTFSFFFSSLFYSLSFFTLSPLSPLSTILFLSLLFLLFFYPSFLFIFFLLISFRFVSSLLFFFRLPLLGCIIWQLFYFVFCSLFPFIFTWIYYLLPLRYRTHIVLYIYFKPSTVFPFSMSLSFHHSILSSIFFFHPFFYYSIPVVDFRFLHSIFFPFHLFLLLSIFWNSILFIVSILFILPLPLFRASRNLIFEILYRHISFLF